MIMTAKAEIPNVAEMLLAIRSGDCLPVSGWMPVDQVPSRALLLFDLLASQARSLFLVKIVELLDV